MHIKSDDRGARKRGELDGIVMAMLSMGLTELTVDSKHTLWSYEHLVSSHRKEDGSTVYKIDMDSITKRANKK